MQSPPSGCTGAALSGSAGEDEEILAFQGGATPAAILQFPCAARAGRLSGKGRSRHTGGVMRTEVATTCLGLVLVCLPRAAGASPPEPGFHPRVSVTAP